MLRAGVPEIRYVICPRVGLGEERIETFYDDMLKALTDPLTDKELESGMYNPPPEARIAFEGTLDDAQEFYQKTTPIALCGNCPMTTWTDGLPIVVPTEEKVKEMLTGTSHEPEEEIRSWTGKDASGNWIQSDRAKTFAPNNTTATVEKVAVIAVMAGCKPEYLPVVLAVSVGTGDPGSTHFQFPSMIVSGPIAKEIGMNAGIGVYGPQNPPNITIGRTWRLFAIAFGGSLPGVNAQMTQGGALNIVGTCFAENAEDLPTGWLGFNEECTYTQEGKRINYTKEESVINVVRIEGLIGGDQYAPSAYRALQTGSGPMAERLGVMGQPGPHNWLEYLFPDMWSTMFGTISLGMNHEMAMHLYNYGFKTKQAVYDWIWNSSFIPVSQMRGYGWYGWQSDSGNNPEPISGVPFKNLPDSFLTPANGTCSKYGGSDTPFNNNTIYITGGEETQHWVILSKYQQRSPQPIDPWR